MKQTRLLINNPVKIEYKDAVASMSQHYKNKFNKTFLEYK